MYVPDTTVEVMSCIKYRERPRVFKYRLTDSWTVEKENKKEKETKDE